MVPPLISDVVATKEVAVVVPVEDIVNGLIYEFKVLPELPAVATWNIILPPTPLPFPWPPCIVIFPPATSSVGAAVVVPAVIVNSFPATLWAVAKTDTFAFPPLPNFKVSKPVIPRSPLAYVTSERSFNADAPPDASAQEGTLLARVNTLPLELFPSRT